MEMAVRDNSVMLLELNSREKFSKKSISRMEWRERWRQGRDAWVVRAECCRCDQENSAR